MTINQAVNRLEKELLPKFEACEMGKGILEGGLNANEKPLPRELAVEMVAFRIAIQEKWGRYFNYKIANWLHRAIWQMGWGDSLDWWAQVGVSGFQSKYRDKKPMPEDLKLALTEARALIES